MRFDILFYLSLCLLPSVTHFLKFFAFNSFFLPLHVLPLPSFLTSYSSCAIHYLFLSLLFAFFFTSFSPSLSPLLVQTYRRWDEHAFTSNRRSEGRGWGADVHHAQSSNTAQWRAPSGSHTGKSVREGCVRGRERGEFRGRRRGSVCEYVLVCEECVCGSVTVTHSLTRTLTDSVTYFSNSLLVSHNTSNYFLLPTSYT